MCSTKNLGALDLIKAKKDEVDSKIRYKVCNKCHRSIPLGNDKCPVCEPCDRDIIDPKSTFFEKCRMC